MSYRNYISKKVVIAITLGLSIGATTFSAVPVVKAVAMTHATEEKTVHENSSVAITKVTTDEEAMHVYLTNCAANVRKDVGADAELLGTLQSGISVTILEEKDGWGYIREFKGWTKMNNLNHVDATNVIGVVCTKNDTNPMFYSAPETLAAEKVVEGYMTFEISPQLYNDEFYKVGDSTYLDKDNVIVDYYAKSYYQRMNAEVSRGSEMITPEVAGPVNMNITEPSGLTTEELHKIVEGTELEGIAPQLKEIEDEHGVNAVFALSVAQLESGNGTSYFARAQNNLFGLDANNGGMSFSTKGECIKYFGKLLRNHYFNDGRGDLYSVGVKYCENPAWPNMVGHLMQKNFSVVR